MKGPSEEQMQTLYSQLRSSKNLFAAWRHVKRSALNSKNPSIRGKAAEFEHSHDRHLRRIADQLREGRFEFDDFEGVLKDKKKREAQGKAPRPIAIGSIKNRVVQRAILQVLQPRIAKNIKQVDTRFEPSFDARLGRLNDINRSSYGVGGLMAPYGGVKPAINLVMAAMEQGGRFFYQSDIKAFFTKIPTDRVVEIVQKETGDDKLSALFRDGLKVNLSNKSDLVGYADLFPKNGIGVAQGSSLSAFAGNVLLYDFDHKLNDMGVTAVRYIDDLLIVAGSQETLDQAVAYAENTLEGFGFSLYPPVPGSDKAATGECSESIRFLGCCLQPGRCVPSKQSVDNLVAAINRLISDSKLAVLELSRKGKKIDVQWSSSNVLSTIGKKVFGWQKSFSFCTEERCFEKLDERILRAVNDYENWIFKRTRTLALDQRMQVLGIPSAKQLFLLDKSQNRQ